MSEFLNFCQKHYYVGFVLFGVGGAIEVLSPHLPVEFSRWSSPLGFFLMVLSAILLAVGLIMVGRQQKQSDKRDSKK
jgi:drug/metabolite transporter (DMT)-like permease